MKITMAIVGLCALFWSSPWGLAQTSPGNPKNGQVLYQRHCLRCHGEALDGKGPDAAALKISPTNFHSYVSRIKDNLELWMTIQRGRSFSAMHNWNDTLTDDQIKDVVSCIRTIAPHAKP